MKLLSEGLRRNRADAGALEQVQAPQIDRQAIGRELGDLIEALFGFGAAGRALVHRFHKRAPIVTKPRAKIVNGRASTSEIQMRTRLVVLVVALSAAVSAQTGVRRSTNVAALAGFPSFYNLRPILVVGDVSQQANGDLVVSDGTSTIHVVARGNTPDGVDEVRGEFWDLGRMSPDDARLTPYDLKSTFHIDPDAGWPRPGQVMAIVSGAVTPASPPGAASIRGMVLYPTRFAGEKVTVTGQFAGRNLLGELPDAPAKSRYDFVLRTADAAIWVTNLRPRGKDFELSLDTRIDTGRWLEVSGILQQGRGLQWIDAAGNHRRSLKRRSSARWTNRSAWPWRRRPKCSSARLRKTRPT